VATKKLIDRTKSTLRSLLPKGAFARGVTVLVGGTAGAQILLVLAAPVLTRIYTPEDFGMLAVYASLLALIGVVSSMRYELAIPLPEDDGEAANVAALCLILVGISTLLAGVLVLLLRQPIAELLGVPSLAGYLWLLPVGVLLGGAYNIFNYWSVRTKRFSAIAGTKLRQALATLAIQLTLFKLGSIALLFGQVAGQSVGIASLGRSALSGGGFRQVSWRGILTAARKYRRFPIFSTLGGFLNSAGGQLPTLLLSAFFSPIIAGLYLLTERVLFGPASIMQTAVSQVLHSHAKECNDKEKYAKLVGNVHVALLSISLPISVVIFFFSPPVFTYVFGESWTEAGRYGSVLAVMFAFQFVSSPLTVVFHSINRPDLTLYYNVMLLILRVIGIFIGYHYFASAYYAIIGFSVFSSIGYLFFSFGTTYAGGLKPRIYFSNHAKPIVRTVTTMFLPIAAFLYFEIIWAPFVLSILVVSINFYNIYKSEARNE